MKEKPISQVLAFCTACCHAASHLVQFSRELCDTPIGDQLVFSHAGDLLPQILRLLPQCGALDTALLRLAWVTELFSCKNLQ